MSLNGTVQRSSQFQLQPKLDGIDSEHCDHWFLPTASKEGFFEIQRFRWAKGGSGNMDGDPLYQEPVLIRAFASLVTENAGVAMDLFRMLTSATNLHDEIQVLIQKKASPTRVTERIKEFQEAQERAKMRGAVIQN